MVARRNYEPEYDGYTIEMAEHLLPDGVRYELHRGQILVMSPAARWHSDTQHLVVYLLRRQGRSASAEIGLLIAPGETRVLDVAVLVPDAGYERAYFRPDEIELAVEVVSPSSRGADYVDKPDLYAELGIAEFWRVDRDEKDIVHVAMFRRDPNRSEYVLTEVVSLDDLGQRPS